MNDNSRAPAPNNPTGRVLHDLVRHDVPDDRDLRADVLRAIDRRRATVQEQPRTWSGPAIDPAARWRQARTTTTSPDTEEYIIMSTASDTTRDGPVPIQQRRWAREALKIAAAAIVFITVGAVLALVLRNDDDTPAIVAPGPTPTATAVPSPSPTAIAQTASPTAAQAAIPTEAPRPSPTALEITPTPIVMGAPAADLPVAGQITANVPVGDGPIAVAAGHGSIWVYNDIDGTLSRIDPATDAVVATISVATPRERSDVPAEEALGGRYAWPDLAVDATSVWAIKPEEQAVVRVDPETNTIVATIPLEAKASSIAVDGSSLWVSLYSTSSVVRIDTTTGEVVATIRDVPTPAGIAVSPDAIWVANYMGDAILRIDPATNQVVDQISFRWQGALNTGNPCLCASDVLANEHGVWVALSWQNAIARIDPATNQLVAIIPVGIQPRSLASDARGVWVGNQSSTGLLLIDPESNLVVAAVPASEAPYQLPWIALSENTIWAARSTNDVVRIDLQPE